MDGRKTTKVLQQQQTFHEEEQYTSISFFSPNPHTLYPMFSTMKFNELKNAKAKRSNSNSFAPSEASSDDPFGKHDFDKSDTDSCSEGGCGSCDACDEEEVSLDELLHDGKTKRKMVQLAAMVGVDTNEPAIVLSEVVRVLKHLKRINQFYLSV